MRAIVLAGLLSAGAAAWAQDDAGLVPVALIDKIVIDDQDRIQASDTEVRVIRARGGTLVPARRALPLFEDDQVITGANVSVILLFQRQATDEEKQAVVAAATQIRVRTNASLFLILGRILSNVRGFFEVGRPECLFGAGGTEFEVRGEPDGSTRLTVLEGAVDVGGTAGAPTRAPDEPAGPGVRVSVGAGQAGSSSLELTVRNGCTQDHIYEIRAPESLAWVSLVGERFAVPAGSKRTVALSLKLDATRVGGGDYRGDVIVKCLDCDQEPGCSVTSQPIPLQVTVKGRALSGASDAASSEVALTRVGRLQELALPRGRPAEAPRAASEDGVRSVLDWSSDVVLSGRPAFSQRGAVPYFESPAERNRVFREARFRAVWSQSAEDYERLGDTYCDWGEGAKGLESYLRAGRANPSRQASPALVARVAEAYRIKGRLKEADDNLRQALALDPRQPLALMSLGNLRLDQASVARDVDDKRRARELLGGAVQAFTDASRTQGGRDLVAIASADRGEANLALGNLAREEGNAADAQERYQAAEKEFQAAQAAQPAYPYSDAGLADAYRGYFGVAADRGDRDRAQAYFQQAEQRYALALKQNRAPFAAWTGLGTLYRQVNRDDRAVEAFTHAVEIQPAEPLAHWQLGMALAKTDPIRAAQELRTYLEMEAPALKQGRRAKDAEAFVKKPTPPEPSPSSPTPAPPVGEVKVPKVEGNKEQDAVRELQKRNLVPRVVAQSSCDKVGRVLAQDPKKDTRVAAGSPVTLTVGSPGDNPVRVPPLQKMPQRRAEAVLQKSGLSARIRTTETSAADPGTVLDQQPGANELLAPGCPVELTVAEAERLVTVPDFRGMSERDAVSQLGFLGSMLSGLARGTVYGGGTGGRVADQDPKPGSQVPRGTRVSLWIRGDRMPESPPDLVRVPNVQNNGQDTAIAVLRRAGLAAKVQGRGGCVSEQSPGAGTAVPRGSTVTLYMGQCPIG